MTTRKAPTKRPRATRSGAKARATGRPYDEATKARALEVLQVDGLAAAHKATGVPKPTLTRWAKAAGVDVGELARARTANATEAVRARAAEVTASTVELLEAHVAQAGDYLGTLAGVNALAARLIAGLDPDKIERVVTLAGTGVAVNDPQVDAVVKVAQALDALPLAARDAEGILTRAIHDLQLLKGEATERGELVVEFTVPRPHPSTGDDAVVEYPALED